MASPLRSRRVLVLGDHKQTVIVARSLARAGFEVILGCEHPRSPTTFSRYVSRTWAYGQCDDQSFRAHLRQYLMREGPDLVFPVGEGVLRRVLPATPSLDALATWVHPGPRAIESCLDKRVTYSITSQLGIPTLPWQTFDGQREWLSSARKMGYPVVIKSKDSANQVAGRKALILTDEEQLGAFLQGLEIDPDPAQLILQKFANGVRHNCQVASAAGRLVGYFQQKVLRTNELDGTGIGTAGISVRPDDFLRAHCERLMRRLDYTGVGCVQFLVDEGSGKAAFLEINPRLDATCALPYRLGYDFPRLAVELALWRTSGSGVTPTIRKGGYAPGKRYHWLCGDLNAWLTAARRKVCSAPQLVRWAISMISLSVRSYHLTFEWRDPLPTLQMLRQVMGRILRRARSMSPLRSAILGKI